MMQQLGKLTFLSLAALVLCLAPAGAADRADQAAKLKGTSWHTLPDEKGISISLELNADGKFRFQVNNRSGFVGEKTGTYQATGDRLTLYADGKVFVKSQVLIVEKDTMTTYDGDKIMVWKRGL
jgi:hypothetical protein